MTSDWTPFDDRPAFEFAELMFEQMQTPEGKVNHLLKVLAAKKILEGGEADSEALYGDYDELHQYFCKVLKCLFPLQWLTNSV
ncbi:hypothetical protein BV25DRAFT_1821973 [Artomyces pyxidatus]|uniref:Uncharacterized protein n=1 Tax=Artomyces pyxidatus TaxID=48021 RepID=A0ACB8T9C4_9AGAM|nr:hypothetical protein BV25DRAFT_1821973 [Artomyces pyxidatus]